MSEPNRTPERDPRGEKTMSTPESDMERALLETRALDVARKVADSASAVISDGHHPDCVCVYCEETLLARALIACREPVTPIHVSNTWKCPNCGHLGIMNYHRYCAKCGRPILWTN